MRDGYPASYYIVGYAVECGLKACIARRFHANAIPERKLVNSVYTHLLENLVGAAELTVELHLEREADADFEAYWGLVKDWRSDSRYRVRLAPQEAKDLYEAVADTGHGVFQWLRRHW